MALEQLHDFFVACASVAGALIGLLFVAISVRPERLSDARETHAHRVRASAALSSFINALTVSLFGLIPGDLLGGTAVAVSVVGIMFVGGSLLSLRRERGVSLTGMRDELFIIGQLAVFVIQLIFGLNLTVHPEDTGSQHGIAIMVIVCFLIGISRSWELIGGPDFGLLHETGLLLRSRRQGGSGGASSDEPEPTSDRPPDPWSGSG